MCLISVLIRLMTKNGGTVLLQSQKEKKITDPWSVSDTKRRKRVTDNVFTGTDQQNVCLLKNFTVLVLFA